MANYAIEDDVRLDMSKIKDRLTGCLGRNRRMTVRLLQAALNLKHGRAVCCARYRGLQAAGPADRGGGGMSEGLWFGN